MSILTERYCELCSKPFLSAKWQHTCDKCRQGNTYRCPICGEYYPNKALRDRCCNDVILSEIEVREMMLDE